MSAAARADGCSRVFVFVWLCGWTVGIIPFDAVAGWGLFHQLRAVAYPTASGVITHSLVSSGPSRANPMHSLALKYEYEVDGQKYTGTRYSYADASTNQNAWRETVAELPVGAAVRVYYAADDPSDALLRPGLSGFHLWGLWFLVPFNAVAVIGWSLVVRGRPKFDPTDPRTVARTDDGWRVQLPVAPRIAVFAGVLLALSVPVIFIGGTVFEMNPPAVLFGWLSLAAIGFAASVAVPWKSHLEVDTRARAIRYSGGEVSFAEVRDVIVKDPAENPTNGFYGFDCRLIPVDGNPVELATYFHQADAAALAAWLRERVGIPPS